MHGLQLPRPSSPSSLPPLDPTPSSSTSSVPPPRQHRAPPPSFAAARVQARQIRGENKSPFVPRAKNHGKDRDLSTLSVDQLADMLARNARLLENPETFSSLPGGDSRLRLQQSRIASRLQELRDVSSLQGNLEGTHLRDRVKREDGQEVKKEDDAEADEGEGEMEDVEKTGVADEASSPVAKRRIAAAQLSTSPHTLSLADSLALQRAAVSRDREAATKKQEKMQIDAARPEKVGKLLKGALGIDSALGEFMFQTPDDSDSEPDDADISDWINEGRRTVNGQLNDEEEEQLNPMRTAYMAGWEKAAAEEGSGP